MQEEKPQRSILIRQYFNASFSNLAFCFLMNAWLKDQIPSLVWLPIFTTLIIGLWTAIVYLKSQDEFQNDTRIFYRRIPNDLHFGIATFALAVNFAFIGEKMLANSLLSLLWQVTFSIVLIIYLTIITAELLENRKVTTMAFAAGLVVFLLYSTAKSNFIEIYGVPIIGHPFEKREFNAKYYIQAEYAEPDDDKKAEKMYTLVADTHVVNESISEEVGEDRYGQTQYASYNQRGIWVRRIRFPNEEWREITKQEEPLGENESVQVTDIKGEKWNVTLSKEPVN
jgi:hypothetical protein